jgi:predicted nuclease of predicted toxin-antitoxin system
MRFLADLNIESQVIRRLREKNHDVRSAAEDFVGAADEIVLAASTSQDRILITNDKDFAELAYLQRKATAGIILVRMAKSSSGEKARRVTEVVGEMGSRLATAMTVIEAHAVRRRELPT